MAKAILWFDLFIEVLHSRMQDQYRYFSDYEVKTSTHVSNQLRLHLEADFSYLRLATLVEYVDSDKLQPLVCLWSLSPTSSQDWILAFSSLVIITLIQIKTGHFRIKITQRKIKGDIGKNNFFRIEVINFNLKQDTFIPKWTIPQQFYVTAENRNYWRSHSSPVICTDRLSKVISLHILKRFLTLTMSACVTEKYIYIYRVS